MPVDQPILVVQPPDLGNRAIGGALISAAVRRTPLPRWRFSATEALRRASAVAAGGEDLRSVLAGVVAELVRLGAHSEQSVERLATDMSLFVARLELLGVPSLRDVDERMVLGFIDEAIPNRSVGGPPYAEPALNTRHFRRTAVRLLFRIARAIDACSHDPTRDIRLPPRSSQRARPLTDDEIVDGELASQHTLVTTRLPAGWALAEATAITSELVTAAVEHLDLDQSRVWLPGGSRRTQRWGQLTEWGVEALRRRAEALNGEPSALLVYGGKTGGKSPQSATCGAVHDVLVQAGLARESDVRPASVAAWRGCKALETTGSIEQVARVLGVRSLDQAAAIIGHDWRLQ